MWMYVTCKCVFAIHELGSVGSLNPNDCADQSSLRKQTQETALSPHLASFDEITERYGTLRSVTGIILHLSYYLIVTSTLFFLY